MNFAQALAIYQAGDTAEAVKIWQQEVQGTAWSGEEKRLAYQYLLQNYPPTSPEYEEYRWALACCLQDLKLWAKALELFWQDESLARLGSCLHHIWQCQMALGQVMAAANTALKLLTYYQRTKKIMLGLKFLEELADSNLATDQRQYFLEQFWLLQGNTAAMAQAYQQGRGTANLSLVENLAAEEILLKVKLDRFWPALQQALGTHTLLKQVKAAAPDDSSRSLSATIVALKAVNGKAALATPEFLIPVLEVCREFIKTAYLKLLYYPAAEDVWGQLAHYAQLLERPKLGAALKNLVSKDPAMQKELATYLGEQTAAVLAVAEDIPAPETVVGACDMASDLFLQELTISDLKAARIKRMERDIAFLQQQGEKSKAQALLQSLQEIDADNTMANGMALPAKPSLAKVSNLTPDKVLAKLDRQIALLAAEAQQTGLALAQAAPEGQARAGLPKASSSLSSDASAVFAGDSTAQVYDWPARPPRKVLDLEAEYRFQERYFLRYLEYLTPAELQPIYRDLIYAWRSLGMAQAGLKLLEKIEQWRHLEQTDPSSLTLMAVKIQDIYLKAMLLGDLGRYYEAIDLLEGQIRFAPLQEDEQVCFWYLLGEYYLRIEQPATAKEIFKRVYQRDPHYRLVQLRMKELEA